MGKIKVNQIENHDANQVEMTAPFQLKSYTTTQRDALSSPQAGWTVFKSTTNKINQYNGSAVRTQRWRLVFNGIKKNFSTELSDISKDPGETTNVASQYPEVVARLKKDYDTWWDSTVPFLVNENLPSVSSNEQPFILRYDQQQKEKGIPFWSPKEIGVK